MNEKRVEKIRELVGKYVQRGPAGSGGARPG
jgi:hypothetical protein